MAQLIFRFNSQDIIHNYQQGEQISSILQSFCHNFGIKRDNFAFLCNGMILNDQSTIQSLTPNNNNQIIILVTDIGTSPPTKPVMRQSESIICPICKESIVLSVRDFKVSLFKCKNGHRMDNIPLRKFKETQNIDISKILCSECKSSKANIYENKMHFCVKCKKNLCPLCKRTHDKDHKIVKYENKFFICEKDFGKFNNYCSTCDKAICSFCENEHDKHHKMTFGTIMGKNIKNIDDLQKNLKQDVNKLKSIFKVITSVFNKISENLDAYFDINETIINTIINEHMNYEQMTSLNEININEIQKFLMDFINSNDIIRIINGIFHIYKRMENVHEINLQKMIEDENEKEKKNVNNENNNQNINNNMINKEQVALQNNNPPQNNMENSNNIINTNSNNQNNNNVINNNEINENKINNNIINNNINNNNANNNNQINNNQIQNNNIINTNVNNNNQINNNNENNNRINNNIINTNNNNINNNININQNSNQNANQVNNNINLDLRPMSSSDEIGTSLISESLDIAVLLNEYIDEPEYLNSVQTIINKYKSIRKIKRDGNGFYRGFIYRIFEYISMNQKTELYNKMLRKIEEARDLAKRNLSDSLSNLIDELYNEFKTKFDMCFTDGVSCRDYLDILFHGDNKQNCNFLVLFIKYSIAGYLRENQIFYEEYFGPDYEWILNEAMQPNKEADQAQISVCVKCFDIEVKIENLTREGVKLVKCPDNRDEKDIFITFLLAKENYDLLYDN